MIQADAIERELKYQMLRLECSWTLEHRNHGETTEVLAGRIASIESDGGICTVTIGDGELRLHEGRVTAIVTRTEIGNGTRHRVAIELQGHESYTFVEGQYE